MYAPAEPEPETAAAAADKRSLSPQTVRSTLTTFGAVVQSYVDQGVLPRNVIALVERPKGADPDDTAPVAEDSPGTEPTAKSWTLAEVDGAAGSPWAVRSARARPSRGAPAAICLPADVVAALRTLRQRQRAEALAPGVGWSDDRLIAVREDGTPLRPESYTDEFQRLRSRAGLRRIKLHGLRNTSVSLMLDQGHPPHIVAAWQGHDPAAAFSIYADVRDRKK